MVQLTLTLAKTTWGNSNARPHDQIATQKVLINDPSLEAKLADGYRVADVKVYIPYGGNKGNLSISNV